MNVRIHLTAFILAFGMVAGVAEAEDMPDAMAELRIRGSQQAVVALNPDVKVEVTIDNPSPRPGEKSYYTVILKNTSDKKITDLFVRLDRFPELSEVAGMEHADCQVSDMVKPVVECFSPDHQLFSLEKGGLQGDRVYFTFSLIKKNDAPCGEQEYKRDGTIQVHKESADVATTANSTIVAQKTLPMLESRCNKIELTHTLKGTNEPKMGTKMQYVVSLKNTGTTKAQNILVSWNSYQAESNIFSANGAHCVADDHDSSRVTCMQVEGEGFSIQPGQTRTFEYTIVLLSEEEDSAYCDRPQYRSVSVSQMRANASTSKEAFAENLITVSDSVEFIPRCEQSDSSSSEPVEPPMFVTSLAANNNLIDKDNARAFFPRAWVTRNGNDHNVVKLGYESPDTYHVVEEKFTAVLTLPAGLYLQEHENAWSCRMSVFGVSVCRSASYNYRDVFGGKEWAYVRVRPARELVMPKCSQSFQMSYHIEGESSRKASNTATVELKVTCGYPCSDAEDNDKDGTIDSEDDGCRGEDWQYDPLRTTEVRKEEPCGPLFPGDNISKKNDAYNVLFVANAEPGFARSRAQAWVQALRQYTPYKENLSKVQFWFVTPKNLSTSDGTSGSCNCEAVYSCPALEPVENMFGGKSTVIKGVTYMCASDCRANANVKKRSIRMPANANNDRVFAHEFGHAFGNLADEYTEAGKGSHVKSNCAPGEEIALETWKPWVNVSEPDIQHGCAYVDTNVRWSANTMMRHHFEANPPDGFGPVNIGFIKQKLSAYSGQPKTMWQSSLLSQLLSDAEGESALRLTLKKNAAGTFEVRSSEVFSEPFGVKPAFADGQKVEVTVGGKTYTQTFAGEEVTIVEDFDEEGIHLNSYDVTPLDEVTVDVGLGETLQKDGVLIGPDLFPLEPKITVSPCSDYDEHAGNDCPEPMLHGAPLEPSQTSAETPDWLSWIFVIGSVASLGIVHWLLKHFVRHGQPSKII